MEDLVSLEGSELKGVHREPGESVQELVHQGGKVVEDPAIESERVVAENSALPE